MPFNYRWARGEEKAQELAEKVSGCKGWSRIENTAKCGGVTCHRFEEMAPGDTDYREYWICYQYTDQWPVDPAKWSTTPGLCLTGDFPQLPKQRLRDGLEKIYR